MARKLKPPKTDAQREQEQRQESFAEKVHLILDYGSEEDFI
jgi:hypothetical protein